MMNQALKAWYQAFLKQPVAELDRLVRGLVPLGAVSQLSLGELLDLVFEPKDNNLDEAVKQWLESHILQPLPDQTISERWSAILDEFFRGIATLGLGKTALLLHTKHTLIRIWLSGLYQGTDRDPEGSYLIALAWNQVDQRFSSLWRRLVLGEEMPGRSYRNIGLLGFRKMPDLEGYPASDVPEGLLRAIVDLADQPAITEEEWSRTVRALFPVYRSSEGYWIAQFKDLLKSFTAPYRANEWLSHVLPHWQQPPSVPSPGNASEPKPVPSHESASWVRRLLYEPSLCDSPGLKNFLNRHRVYARATGDSLSLVKTFNGISNNVAPAKPLWAIDLIKEALDWEPYNERNWTVYAESLWQAHKQDEALDVLWQARQRFPSHPFIWTALGRYLREKGDLEGSKAVYREASTYFPANVFCRSELGNLLVEVNELDEAERVLEEGRQIDSENLFIRNQLAEVWFIKSARRNDTSQRERARALLQKSAKALDSFAMQVLQSFDHYWNLTRQEGRRRLYGKELSEKPVTQFTEKDVAEMSPAERLGRGMIALHQAEKATSNEERNQSCDWADRLIDMSETEVAELLTALVETRGLVLLARGNAVGAYNYFINQIEHYGRGSWISVRLGFERARMLCGDVTGELADFDSQSARFALQVAQVIRFLVTNADEHRVADLLCEVYPLAASFADGKPAIPGAGPTLHTNKMISDFLNIKWFHPADVRSTTDLADPDRMHRLYQRIRETSDETFNVLASVAPAMAA